MCVKVGSCTQGPCPSACVTEITGSLHASMQACADHESHWGCPLACMLLWFDLAAGCRGYLPPCLTVCSSRASWTKGVRSLQAPPVLPQLLQLLCLPPGCTAAPWNMCSSLQLSSDLTDPCPPCEARGLPKQLPRPQLQLRQERLLLCLQVLRASLRLWRCAPG